MPNIEWTIGPITLTQSRKELTTMNNHKNRPLIFFFLAFITFSCNNDSNDNQLKWPESTIQTKPWTRWWWHGNAVTKEGITYELENIHQAGMGGVELTPIFGVIGNEDEFIDFLSPQWMEMFMHVLAETKRLGLGVDMATGTGWPFGGPWVGTNNAPKTMKYTTYELEEGGRLDQPVVFNQQPTLRSVHNEMHQFYQRSMQEGNDVTTQMVKVDSVDRSQRLNISQVRNPVSSNNNLQALALDQVQFERELRLITLMAYEEDGQILDLTNSVSSNTHLLDWIAPKGKWTLYALFEGDHGKMVERAAPGGEGNTIDHFSEEAINNYLLKFDSAFAGKDISYLRAFFNDSYEVDDARGVADWTPMLFEAFEQRRGYTLKEHLPALFGKADEEENLRVLSDFRETINDLILSSFTENWKKWAEEKGAIIRNQSHGSPGNVLDLYAASDIPETEGTDPISIKLASSAAHVSGKLLTSSESATWLNEHFLSTLSDVKTNLERYMLGGVNHVFYHGTAYSPKDEAWPGRLFYAAIHANNRNSWWDDFSALNLYVSRVQSFLQSGQPSNEVLLYLPMYDLYATPGSESLLHFDLGKGEFGESKVKENAIWMKEQGYSFDFISDLQLQKTTVNDGEIVSEGLSYKTILIPSCEFMPLETLEKITSIANSGAKVLFQNNYPKNVPGYGSQNERQNKFEALIKSLPGIETATIGKDLETLLNSTSERELLVEKGLEFTRRKHDDGYYYFIINQSGQMVDDYVPLNIQAKSIALFNPMNGIKGIGAMTEKQGKVEVLLQLMPGESCIVATFNQPKRGLPYPYIEKTGEAIPFMGPWEVKFIKGGPTIPKNQTIDRLDSWTTFEDEGCRDFSGTAAYTISFDRPKIESEGYLLSLGEVKESAKIFLNEKEVGTLIGPTYQLYLDADSLKDKNVLEIRVSNLMANRIASMDRKRMFWKKFYNVNFPARLEENRLRGLFVASHWEPMNSGLLGPVFLSPVQLKPVK